MRNIMTRLNSEYTTDSETDSSNDGDDNNEQYYAQENAAYISDDDDDDTITNQICIEEEEDTDYTTKTHGNYYIGSISHVQDNTLLALSIKPRIFFKYDVQSIQQYLCEYSGLENTQESIEIIQLQILPDLTYACIVKTHWLRLIQKHWRKAYARRKHVLNKRKSLVAMQYFAVHGKYIDGLNQLPTVHGLLREY